MDPEALADRVLQAPPRLGRVRVVAVDGGAAAGKSTLAAALVAALQARGRHAVHLRTDFLLDGWDDAFTYWPRLREGVLTPLREGRPGRHPRYDWDAGRFDGTVEVPVPDVLVVDGVGSIDAVGDAAALTVWLELDRASRERRWVERDRMPLQPEWVRWLDAEDAWFAIHPVHADVVIDRATDRDTVRDGPDGVVPIRTLDSRTVYESAWMRIREDEIAYADGGRGRYSVVVKGDFALVVAEERGGFWMVQQYRYPTGSRQWEFPQGGWPAGRTGTGLELAREELAEETGLRAQRWDHLGRPFAVHGYSGQAYDVYRATDLTPGPPHREATEQDMVHRWFPEAEVRAMVVDSRLADAHSLAALTLLDARRRIEATTADGT